MKRFLTSVSLHHEPKASDVVTLVKKTFFARVSYEILYHEVWNKISYEQHEPKASDVITLVKKTFFARVSYEILYHEVWNKI